MQRRGFLKSLSSLPLIAGAAELHATTDGVVASGDEWQQAFHAALAEKPWLRAFASAGQDQFAGEAKLTGQVPEGLSGSFYRNGPARHEIGGFRYHHWFDGDGMLQAWRIGEQSVRHQANMIATRKYLAEQDAGRALYPGFATLPPNPAPVTSPDLVNVGNISVLHHHGRLLALWEAGSPWLMDEETLTTEALYQFSDDTRGLPFSAHPRVEPDGTLWNFGYVSQANLLVLWHLDAAGKLVKVGTLPCDPISMPHDFIVTSRHIVLMIPPLHFEPDPASEPTFLASHQWHPEKPTRVAVIDKNDFKKVDWYELPAQWVFHFGNGWEDDNGVIHFDGARAPDPLAMIETFSEVMRGRTPSGASSHHTHYRIDTRRRNIAEVPMFSPRLDTEFPVIDPRVSCRRNRRLTMLAAHLDDPAPHGMLNSVATFDYDGEAMNRYRYPDHVIPEEHLFVPAPGSKPESGGWVVGTALDYRAERTQLNVFDANHVDAGPLASATLPYALPMGLHAKFVAA